MDIDGRLSLFGDVDFYLLSAAGVRTTFLRSEQYEILEGLTGVRIGERLFLRGRCVPCCRVGLMPAVWLNGTILVKKLHNKRCGFWGVASETALFVGV